ncbi:heavy-metal-associated domain-containing protein [Zestomonas thermotolerans]|uniref:heavy-metal-associated domain-containing protein n=1 Tax=Zestomonas thermotolerans TaxID=157784 RepID=UPI000371AB36|nr:cation transporter [Pseudomonas thermotolerans]
MRIFKVRGMSCGHCVRAVTQALQARDPQARVQVDLGTGEVRVEGSLSDTAVLEAIREEGYQAEPA